MNYNHKPGKFEQAIKGFAGSTIGRILTALIGGLLMVEGRLWAGHTDRETLLPFVVMLVGLVILVWSTRGWRHPTRWSRM